MHHTDRTLECVRFATIVLVAMGTLGGCTALLLGSPDGERPAAVAGDRQLADDVRRAFAAARVADRAAIAVTARDGVVTLSGKVSSATARTDAERVARGVTGVRQVVNNLQ